MTTNGIETRAIIDRLREVIADSEPEPLGNESALLVGGE